MASQTLVDRLAIAVLALRKIQEREWPAADHFKAACNATEMWDIADKALTTIAEKERLA